VPGTRRVRDGHVGDATGKKLTLMNTADGTRYVLLLVSVG